MVQLANYERTDRSHSPPSPTKRVERLLRTEIDFIMNPAFARVDREFERQVLESGTSETAEASTRFPRNLPGHLARLCEARVLTAEEEQKLFRRMNYLKYRANSIRAVLDPRAPDPHAIHRAECFLSAARSLRDRLIKANMRLVISVVKRFVTSVHSFDDLLSDGIYSLMQAVDKFDYDRGFRFSTYAYRAIARNAYRKITKHQKEAVRFSSEATESATDELVDSRSPLNDVRAQTRLRESLSQLIKQLDRREQMIIRCRFALGSHRKAKTFQAIADKLGVSKERVRQLEQRAMSKLR